MGRAARLAGGGGGAGPVAGCIPARVESGGPGGGQRHPQEPRADARKFLSGFQKNGGRFFEVSKKQIRTVNLLQHCRENYEPSTAWLYTR